MDYNAHVLVLMHAMQTSIGLFHKYYKCWLSAYENSERRVEMICLQLLL